VTSAFEPILAAPLVETYESLSSLSLNPTLSYAVTRRTREIGVRVAVGAQRQNVLWLVLRETLGIAIGIPSALVATPYQEPAAK
jgi:hypothetical protein